MSDPTPVMPTETPPASGGTPAPVAPVVPAPIPAGYLTQAQVDKLIQDRLRDDQERRAKDLGVTNWDEAKKEISAAKKAKQDQMSDMEKQTARLTELEQAHQQALAKSAADVAAKDAELAQLRQAQAKRDIRDAIIRAATPLFRYAEDAYVHADLSKVTLDKEGQVQGADDAVKAVAERRKDLLAIPAVHNINGQNPVVPQVQGDVLPVDIRSLMPPSVRSVIK